MEHPGADCPPPPTGINGPATPPVEPAPALQGRRSPRAILAWVVILLVVGVCIGRSQFGWLQHASALGESSPGLQMQLSGRYFYAASRGLIGLNHEPGVIAAAKYQQRIESQARTPADQVAAAVLISALRNRRQALRRLDALVEPSAKVPPQVAQDALAFKMILDGGAGTIPATRRAALERRYGWFADLALAQGLPPHDPARWRVQAQAQWVMVVLLGAVLTIGVILVSGLILLLLAAVFWVRGRLPMRYPLRSGAAGNSGVASAVAPARRSAYVEAFAAYLAGFIGLGRAQQ